MAKSHINLEIVSVEKSVFQDTVDLILAQTPQGQITILPNHVPIISLLEAGEIELEKDNTRFFFALSGGFIEVRPNKVTILAETAERAEEIDEKRAEQARKEAENLLKEKDLDEIKFADAKAALQRSLLRLKVAKRRTRKRRSRIQ